MKQVGQTGRSIDPKPNPMCQGPCWIPCPWQVSFRAHGYKSKRLGSFVMCCIEHTCRHFIYKKTTLCRSRTSFSVVSVSLSISERLRRLLHSSSTKYSMMELSYFHGLQARNCQNFKSFSLGLSVHLLLELQMCVFYIYLRGD